MNSENFELALNMCFNTMKANKMKYMVSLERQNELVSTEFDSFKLDSKYIPVLANFIYFKINKYDSLTIQHLYNYLLDYYNNSEYKNLLNLIEKMKLEKQGKILNKVIDITYCKDGYSKTKSSFPLILKILFSIVIALLFCILF